LFLIILSLSIGLYSCGNTPKQSPLSDSKSSLNGLLPYDYNKVRLKDSVNEIASNTIQQIRENGYSSNIEKVLETIYRRDQIYRDSFHLYSNNADKRRELSNRFKQCDDVNQQIISWIFDNLGWVDTREMSQKASEAIWITIVHCNDNKDFSKKALKYLNIAFKEDSIISNRVYAITTDRILIQLEGKPKYGTLSYFGLEKEYDSATIAEFNIQRSEIGLAEYLHEEGYY